MPSSGTHVTEPTTIPDPPRGPAVRSRARGGSLGSDPRWYQDAIIYQLHVRSFCDSNGDGIGDFRGLTEKLPYVQSLGVTAIWLLPFFPSPLKDDGYDIADYTSINPAYGTVADFEAFVATAHDCGLRVITELVMNHTSDQHAWFQRARRAAPGSRWRDYYVWSDSNQRYRDARIIFHDFESSNWSWDPVAQAYYWHRFYHHQPDLNFENPEVQQAMFQAIDYWLERGVDGLRLDAVPYLYELDGTDCENLPATHTFLKQLREHVDSRFTDKMLLAEANQWPEDAAAYFGDGDECHMNFHFPLMPRLYIAVEQEDNFPIVDILDQTPALPDGCQWGIFLRNHDELTLEMVTDEERDYMYRAYASDPQTRLNQGIRRRLAPLLQNNRRKIELLNGLLCSLPGTPIVYYGDEIGMGDNIYLGDRDGVRTPMQWSPDRNAGFSRSSPHRLYLPVIVEPAYHYTTINVEVEHESPHSLLWWMRRLLHLRARYRAFGRGDFRLLKPDNAKVLAFLRRDQDQTLLVVANLSRFPQCVELDLAEFRGQAPIELFGSGVFPPIGELPYLLTLGGHAFYWFQLKWESESDVESSPTSLPVCHLDDDGLDADGSELFAGPRRSDLNGALRRFLRRVRWFQHPSRRLHRVELVEAWRLDGRSPADPADSHAESRPDLPSYWLLIVQLELVDHPPVWYQIPVVIADPLSAQEMIADHPAAGILNIEWVRSGGTATLCEASWRADFWALLYRRLRAGDSLPGYRGEWVPVGTERGESPNEVDGPAVDLTSGDDDRAAAVIDGRWQLTLFRRPIDGPSPALELDQNGSPLADLNCLLELGGVAEYRRESAAPLTLAALVEYRPHEGTAWNYTLDALGRYLEQQLAAEPADLAPAPITVDQLVRQSELPTLVDERQLLGVYLVSIQRLGTRTAELHTALATPAGHGELAAQPFSELYQRSLYQAVRAVVRRSLDALERRREQLPQPWRQAAQRIIDSQALLLNGLRQDLRPKLRGQRIRCHGSYDLHHLWFTGDDFLITPLPGKPGEAVSELRIRSSPLRDLAALIGSLAKARHAALDGQTASLMLGSVPAEQAERWMQQWFVSAAATLLSGYRAAIAPAQLIPDDPQHLANLLRVHLMETWCMELLAAPTADATGLAAPLHGLTLLVEEYGPPVESDSPEKTS